MSKTVLVWVTAAALAFGLSAVAGTSYSPSPAPADAPMAVPARACPPGFVGIWVDSTTAECLRELP